MQENLSIIITESYWCTIESQKQELFTVILTLNSGGPQIVPKCYRNTLISKLNHCTLYQLYSAGSCEVALCCHFLTTNQQELIFGGMLPIYRNQFLMACHLISEQIGHQNDHIDP
jgi:hypothetical protein